LRCAYAQVELYAGDKPSRLNRRQSERRDSKVSIDEVLERGLTVDENGKVLDEFGHEYRNEQGLACYVKESK